MLKETKAFSGFSTNNLQEAKSFYNNILGIKADETEMGILELHTKGNNPIIIYPKPDHAPASFTVLNFIVKNIEETVDQLIAKGIKFEQYEGAIATDEKGICRNNQGPSIAWFKDPAGNIIAVIEQTVH